MIYAKGFFIFPSLPFFLPPSFIPGNGAGNGAPTRKRAALPPSLTLPRRPIKVRVAHRQPGPLVPPEPPLPLSPFPIPPICQVLSAVRPRMRGAVIGL